MALFLHMAQIERLPLSLDFSLTTGDIEVLSWTIKFINSNHGPFCSRTCDEHLLSNILGEELFSLVADSFNHQKKKKKIVKSLPRKWARKWAGECLCLSWATHRLGWHTPKAWLEGVTWGTLKNGSHCGSTQPLGSRGDHSYDTCACAFPPTTLPLRKKQETTFRQRIFPQPP